MENYSPGEILETVAPKPFSMLHSYGDGKISCFFPFLFIFCHWYIMILALLSDFDIVCPCPRRLSRVGLVGAPAWKWHRSKYFIFHICVGAVFTSWVLAWLSVIFAKHGSGLFFISITYPRPAEHFNCEIFGQNIRQTTFTSRHLQRAIYFCKWMLKQRS